MYLSFYKNKKVFVTGHTGFKGSWLTQWLLMLGAEVYGYALDPQPHEVLFDQLGLSGQCASDTRADLADRAALSAAIDAANPDVIFHLAAQPLVRLSYDIPIETFATNVMGTAHLLDAARLRNKDCAIVCITTDKCYENREWLHAYREEDAMGGHDPYSASKGAAELVISSFRNSYFAHRQHNSAAADIRVASVRAGNVIGGGDWAKDRIVPDCIRALREQQIIPVRNKIATRPWQHVLEPLSGYLWIGALLGTLNDTSNPPIDHFCSAFNFGPALTSNRTVAELVQELLKHTGGEWRDASDPHALHEASKLNLATDKAFHLLGWQPVWNFSTTIHHTAEWYLEEQRGNVPSEITIKQILAYQQAAQQLGLPWANQA